MVIEESVLDGFMDRQEDTIDNFFDSILYPSDNDIIERIEKNRTIAGFNVFAEPKNKKIKLAERQPEDTLESYIEAKYLKGVVEPMAALVISDAVNRGRDNAIKSVDGINITHAEWSANLEGNPCPFCAERNGQIVSINNPDYVDCQPPVHPNCECIWVYFTGKERTGDGNLIEEDWTPPADEDRLKFRMFDIYNAKDLDNLAEIFASKAVRISEEQEEILYSRIQKIRDKILMEGSIDIENILGWQKLIPEDSEKVKNEKR